MLYGFELTMWLTEEAKGPAHQWVEVTAVPRGNRLLRPVELFGRVLDQEQHSLCYCDLVETKARDTKRERLNLWVGVVVLAMPIFSHRHTTHNRNMWEKSAHVNVRKAAEVCVCVNWQILFMKNVWNRQSYMSSLFCWDLKPYWAPKSLDLTRWGTLLHVDTNSTSFIFTKNVCL